jgi:ribonucleotide reductase alpha subunit
MHPRKIFRDASFSFVKGEEAAMTARELFDHIVQSAWKTGEPGKV